MAKFTIHYAKALMCFGICVILSACVTRLAPNYDQAVVSGLIAVNQKTMELFAASAGGTNGETFEQRESSYNFLIGYVDALAIQAQARPVPKNDVTERVNEQLRQRGVEVLAEDEIPSVSSLAQLSRTLAKMRQVDQKQGLTSLEVQAFKNTAAICMDQALTYESYLER